MVEFQTPVFERKILTAYQEVVTQSGWDIDDAVHLIDPGLAALVTRRSTAPVATLAVTPGFRVERRNLMPGQQFELAAFSILWRLAGTFEAAPVIDDTARAFMTTRATTIGAVDECSLIVAEET